MLVTPEKFFAFKLWCERNEFQVKESLKRVKVKVYNLTYEFNKNQMTGDYIVPEGNEIWNMFLRKLYIPGIPIQKTKIKKILPDFDWKTYPHVRVYWKDNIHAWILYGCYMVEGSDTHYFNFDGNTKEIKLAFIKVLNTKQLIKIMGEGFERTYWETICTRLWKEHESIYS